MTRPEMEHGAGITIMISATGEDLQEHVAATIHAVRSAGCEPSHFEDTWGPTGRPSVSECRDRVLAADALIVIVAHRYGWIPGDEQGGEAEKSITQLEVETARDSLKPVLPFLIDGSADWPADHREATGRKKALLTEFKAELTELRARLEATFSGIFSTPAHLHDLVQRSVQELKQALAPISASHAGGVMVYGQRAQGQFGTFRDRTSELSGVVSALRSEKFRGVSIIGKGGFGKSALANKALDELRGNGEIDGCAYLPSSALSPIHPYDVFKAVMSLAGVSPIRWEGAWPRLAKNPPLLHRRLTEHCRRGRFVFVLDGFESALGGRGQVKDKDVQALLEAFLASDHASSVLITTRVPPSLRGHVAQFLAEEELGRGLPVDDAVKLLSSLLKNRRDLDLNEAKLRAFAAAVDGIPFLLERAYEVVSRDYGKDLQAESLEEELLDGIIDRVMRNLSDQASHVLEALAVFGEPVPVEAIRSVLDGFLDAEDVDRGLDEALRGRLAGRTEGGIIMHDLDRAASYRRARAGDRSPEELHARAALYYQQFTRTRNSWYGWRSRTELEPDLKSFRHWLLAGHPARAARCLDITKVEFMNWMGHVDEIRELYGGLDVAEDREAELIKRYALGDSLVVLGPWKRAIEELDEVIALAKKLSDEPTEIAALYESALACRYEGRADEAFRRMNDALDRPQLSEQPERRAYYLFGYGLACTYAGRHVAAFEAATELLQFGQAEDAPALMGRAAGSLSLTFYVVGLRLRAAEFARAAIRDFEKSDHLYLIGFAENTLGLALIETEDVEGSVGAFVRAYENARQQAQRRVEGIVSFNRAWLHYELGNLDRARAQVELAVAVFKETNQNDLRLARHLSDAIRASRVTSDDQGPSSWALKEVESLWALLSNEYENPDLVSRTRVADVALVRARLLDDVEPAKRIDAHARKRESRMKEMRDRIDALSRPR